MSFAFQKEHNSERLSYGPLAPESLELTKRTDIRRKPVTKQLPLHRFWLMIQVEENERKKEIEREEKLNYLGVLKEIALKGK